MSPAATRFLQRAGEFFSARDYRLGADVSGLMTERQEHAVEFVAENVLEILGSAFGIHGGPTGTKSVASDRATVALAPFTELTDLLVWKTSEIVPLIVADHMTAESLQLLLDAYFQLALNAANALSIQKYGGFIRIFPLLAFTGHARDLSNVRSVTIVREQKSFFLHVYLNAGVLTLADSQVFWPTGTKLSKPLSEIGSLLIGGN